MTVKEIERVDMKEYVDDTVIYVPPTPLENHMNDGVDPSVLSKYLDPEFLNASPDDKGIVASMLEAADQDNRYLDLDLDDETLEAELLEKNNMALLQPREYQYELYEKALKENIIAVLDTGSGKTLIAVMLIKQMALQERQARLTRRETKLAFFLVDRVPLVFQQAHVISSNCDLVVEKMCGEMEVDSWSEKRWRQIFEVSDVCVMTAQIFLDCLRSGYIHMTEVHLLIFDECHHTTKYHSFNMIMREFYDVCPVEQQPKIFGMTASPMHARSSVESSVQRLEKNLDAKIYTATNLENLNIAVNKPKEIVLNYAPPPIYKDTEVCIRIREKLGLIERYKRCFIFTSDILITMGTWCCDHMWKIMLTDLERKMSALTQDLDKEALIDEDLALKETHEFIDPIVFSRNPDYKDVSQFSPKVAKLITVLNVGQRINGFCGIIFVERRLTAVALKLLIDSLDIFANVRCDILTGHGTTEEGDIQMTFKDQNKVIAKFRTGELNLLIATNVAEEGLDIQPCNFVVRFDFFHTLIAYIQSRGRARRADSKYILFTEHGNANQAGLLQEFRMLEEEMKIYCQTMPEDRNVANKFMLGSDPNYNPDDDIDFDDDDYLEAEYSVLSTGAKVTKSSAIPLIHRYCSSLPSDTFCVLKPIFEIKNTGEGYICKLTLPSNAAIQEMESPISRTKGRAKALVSLLVAEELHKLGALNDNLQPRNIRNEILGEMAPQFDENGLIIGSRRRHGLYEKRTPSLWSRIIEEEDEVAGVEDNEDLLKAQAQKEGAPPRIESNGTHINDTAINGATTNGTMAMSTATIGDILAKKEEAMIDVIKLNKVSSSTLVEYEENGIKMLDLDASEIKPDEEDEDETEDIAEEEEVEEELEDPNVLEEGPFHCWFTIIEVQLQENKFEDIPLRPLCLISKRQFPDLPELKMFHKSSPFMVKMRSVPTELVFERDEIQVLSDYMKKLMLALLNKEFDCPINEIPYYIIPFIRGTNNPNYEGLSAESLKSLIDWQEVNNITERKECPLVLEEVEDPTDVIVIDGSDRSRRYFVMNVRHDMTPQTFPEYLNQKEYPQEADPNQPMMEVRRLKKVMNFLYPGQIVPAQLKGPVKTWTVPQFCQKFFMSSSVYQAMIMIPSIMTRVDSLLLCREAKDRYDLPIDDANFLEAYTTPSASMEMDYERLETLGDSFLKFIATIRLYINFPFSNEGELHHLRIRVICNRALYRSAKRLKFYRYVTSQTFNRRYWRPPGFRSPADNLETMKSLNYHKLSDKTLADIVEASLGAAYISNGLEGGLHTAIQMQIPFDEIKEWKDFNPTFEESRKRVPPRAEVRELRKLNLPQINQICGREFAKPLLVVEALTHASLPNSTCPCYQRLEFLGDAILDFLVIRYLYSKYPQADPGMITDLKDSCVNNHVLGIICFETKLFRHIIHYSGRLIRAIETYCEEVQSAKDDGTAIGEYWVDFNTPKVLSDVVESMLGAVFVDSGFRLEPCEELFARWFLPVLDNHVTPELIRIHPLRKLITDLQRFGCDGFMLRNHGSGETGPESQKCVIFLHDKPLATGSDWNIKTARRHAATKASQRLEEEPTLLESVCNCRVSMIKRGLLVEEYDDEES